MSVSLSFVKASSLGNVTSSPATAAFTGGNTTGNLLVIGITELGTTTTEVTGISDTEGNVWTLAGRSSGIQSSGGTFVSTIYYAPVTSGGSGTNTVTVTFSSVPSRNFLFGCEYTPSAAATYSVDTTAQATQGTTTLNYTLTAANANELIFCIAEGGNGNNAWTTTGNARSATNNFYLFFDYLASASGSNTINQVSTLGNPAGFSAAFIATGSAPVSGAKLGQPTPVTETNSSGYSLPITSPTVTSRAGQPTPVCFTDPNGNEYTITGSTKGSYIVAPTPVVLCDSTGHPITPPIVLTSNGNSVTVTSTPTGTKLGQPKPMVLTDANGNSLAQSGFSYGSMAGNPTPGVLTDVNGNVITLTLAT
jgi:hypothetical protein